MGLFFTPALKLRWNHFGYKLSLNFSKKDLETSNLFEVLMKKIVLECPKFNGLVAYYDNDNRQILITNDTEFRQALEIMKSKLKIHTTVPERASLPVAEKVTTRFRRSYSVPPQNVSMTASPKPSNASTTATTVDSKPKTSDQRKPSIQPNQFSARYERKSSAFSRGQVSTRSGTSCSSRSSTVYPTTHYPIGYHQSYSSYNNAPTGPIGYGVPPLNLLLSHLLTGGHHYHPLHPAYAPGAMMGPNRFMGGFAW